MKEIAATIASVIVIFGGISAAALWLTGGFEPQSRVEIKEMATKITDMQQTLAEMQHSLRAMPRPIDYANQDAHLSRLDGQVSALGDRVGRDEVDAAGMKSDAASTKSLVQRLLDASTPIRQPR